MAGLKKIFILAATKRPAPPSPKERALKKEETAVKVSSQGRLSQEAAAKTFAAIFDMDGTLIDNTPYHFKSWQALFKHHNKGRLSKHTYYSEISGVPVMETIKRIFGKDHDEAGLKELLDEKENYYRKEYEPYVKPIKGLKVFLSGLKKAGVKIAMGTSATIEDINFILDKIPIRDDFDVIINSSMVTEPKPHPQIYLKAAEKLKIRPENCVVFEDSLAGIKAANNAGMKVVGITTGHTAKELHPVDMVINDYADLSAAKLAALFEK